MCVFPPNIVLRGFDPSPYLRPPKSTNHINHSVVYYSFGMPLAPDFIVRSVSREPWKANRRPSKPCQDWLVELELCVQHLMSLHQVYKCVVPFKNKRSLAHALGDSLSKQRRWLRGKNSGTSMHPTSFPRRGTHGTGRYLRSPAGAGPWTKQNSSSKAGWCGDSRELAFPRIHVHIIHRIGPLKPKE